MPRIEPIEPGQTIGTVTPDTTAPSQKKIEALQQKIAESTVETEQKPAQAKPTAETPAKEITADTSPQDAMRIAAAIRKEKQLRKQAKALEDERRKFQEESRAFEPWKEAAEMAKQNKLKALEKLGITYDELTQIMLNNGELPPATVAQQSAEEVTRREIAKLRAELAAEQQKNQEANYEQARKQIAFEAESIASTTDRYPLVKESEAYHDVSEYIEEEFHRTGKIIPVEVALEKMELQIAEGILRLAKIEKIKSQLLPQESVQEQKIEPRVAQPNQKIQTITHKSTVPPPATRPTSESERIRRAIDAFNGRFTA